MKMIIVLLAMLATPFIQKTFAQNTAAPELQSVISDYLSLKNALTNDNVSEAKEAANAMYASIKKVPMENLVPAQHKTWMKNSKALLSNTSYIGGSMDITAQRKQFEDLSTEVYSLLRVMKINNVDLYYQYCPMADSYWISDNKKIENPYYGKKMLTCGSVKETMNAKN